MIIVVLNLPSKMFEIAETLWLYIPNVYLYELRDTMKTRYIELSSHHLYALVDDEFENGLI
jgi:hypothetical protein